jgi:O-antigen/teichoic acid export membrane protein
VDDSSKTDAPAGLGGRLLSLFIWLKSKNQIWGLADQAVVSVTSFATMIIIARSANATQLGIYAIGNSLLVMLLTVQDSLITRPYSVQLFRPPGTPEEHGFSALLLSGVLSFLAFGAALGVAAFLAFQGSDSASRTLALVIAFVAPLALFREFGRRYSFANLKMYRAFAVDTAAAVLSLLPMIYFGWTGSLTANTAIIIIGCGAGLSGTLWFVRRRHAFRYSLDAFQKTFWQSWALGKWLLCSQVAMQLQGYAAHWLCLFLIGASATGTYAACLSIVALANPFLYGFFNLLTPKSVRTLRDQGVQELRRQVARDSLLLAGLMMSFTIFIYFAGETIMSILYAGKEYTNKGPVLTVLALASVAGAVGAFGAPAAIALQSAERGPAIAGIAVATCVSGSLVSWLFISFWGLTGAAWGLLVIETVGAAGRWLLFLSVKHENSSST